MLWGLLFAGRPDCSTPAGEPASAADYFGEQERLLSAKIKAHEADLADAETTEHKHNALIDVFERAAALLRDPKFDFDTIWDNANDKERRVIVEELIDVVTIHADRVEVTVTGAPPLLVTLAEVGLHDSGTGTVVSKGVLSLTTSRTDVARHPGQLCRAS